MIKVPDGDAENADLSVPAGNLYMCVATSCDGPGEGSLFVYERVFNVHTGDQDGDGLEDGLGAYEFTVTFDNTIFASVVPQDVVFFFGGAGEGRGPSQCGFSLFLENSIRFACATAGPLPPGPTGSFDLARILLIPQPDLIDVITPADNNGIVTLLNDSACELADVFGHPVNGSVGGGLLPICRDVAITVRILEGDLNLDCKVDIADAALIAEHVGATFGSAGYSTWYDLEPATPDGDIDVKDVEKVTGREGSTCQHPIPAQPPGHPPVPFP